MAIEKVVLGPFWAVSMFVRLTLFSAAGILIGECASEAGMNWALRDYSDQPCPNCPPPSEEETKTKK